MPLKMSTMPFIVDAEVKLSKLEEGTSYIESLTQHDFSKERHADKV